MRVGSRSIERILLAIAYAVALGIVAAALAAEGERSAGLRYVQLLAAVLLLATAHGYALVRRGHAARLESSSTAVRDVTTDVALWVWEVLLGWVGVAAALMFLHYAAPAEELREWYPRLFLCLVVFFGAMYHRALIFIFAATPFVFTVGATALWDEWAARGPSVNAAVLAGFLALDLAVLWHATVLARRHGVFEPGEFEMPLGPGRVGGMLAGVVRGGQQSVPEAGYQLDLSCIRQSRERGGRATGEVLFHFRRQVRGELPSGAEDGGSVPVRFDLPATALASVEADGARIAWTLRAAAQLPETDYSRAFEVPVAEASYAHDPALAAWNEENLPGLAAPSGPDLAESDGRPRTLRFGGRWNRSSELIAAAYCLFWFQLIWLATDAGVDGPVWAMFAVGLWFLGSLLAPWRWRYEARVEGSRVRVRRSGLFGGKEQSVEAGDVTDIDVVPTGLRTGLVDALPFYAVRLTARGGRKLTVAAHLRERRAAEALAGRLRAALMGSPAVPSRPAPVAVA